MSFNDLPDNKPSSAKDKIEVKIKATPDAAVPVTQPAPAPVTDPAAPKG